MCGIVGLFAKSASVEERLGEHLGAMLVQMSSRGPDSAGVAVYRSPAPDGASKLTLYSADPAERWGAVRDGLCDAFATCAEPAVRASHAVFVVDADAEDAERWIRENRPDLRVMSAGTVIEIYKEVGLPRDFALEFALTDFRGSHALGHTRMATESKVTTEGSHPFSTGFDLCLVHNGSLSNHNRLRELLRREGIEFQTENDTEVAAGYLAWLAQSMPPLNELIVPFFKHVAYPLGTVGFIVLTFFVIVGTSNAVNLTDGLDGLAIMPTVMVGSALGIFAYVAGHAVFSKYLGLPYIVGAGELAVICGALAGAGLGFLWFNAYPAEVFMGDVGALALGAALGTIAVIVRQEIVLFIMGGVFVAETLSVMIQVLYFKYSGGKRIFRMAPLHHHYELEGWKESQVVVRFWIITMMLVLFGLSTLKLR